MGMGRKVNPFVPVEPDFRDTHAVASAMATGILMEREHDHDPDDWVAAACNRDAATSVGEPAELCF